MRKRIGPRIEDRRSKIASLRARRSSIFDPLSSSLGDLSRHIAALNLSGGGARDRLDDVNHFWTFEIGERRAAMGDQLRFGRLARECYRRRDLFAVNPVRDAEAHRFSYRLVGEQHFINLSWRYFLATAIDQLFDTANQRQIAVAVQIPLIPRAEPALRE